MKDLKYSTLTGTYQVDYSKATLAELIAAPDVKSVLINNNIEVKNFSTVIDHKELSGFDNNIVLFFYTSNGKIILTKGYYNQRNFDFVNSEGVIKFDRQIVCFLFIDE